MTSHRLSLVAAAALVAGCATVKQSYVAPDWKAADATRVKRLVAVVTPLPKDDPKLGDLFAQMARNYANLKREFMVKSAKAQPLPQGGSFEPKALCGEGLEGVLWLSPTVQDQGTQVKETLTGKLVRCSDGQEVWGAHAEGTWNREDTALDQMAANYMRDLGSELGPYIAPAFHILKPTLDTLPNPVLTDQEQEEKTESD